MKASKNSYITINFTTEESSILTKAINLYYDTLEVLSNFGFNSIDFSAEDFFNQLNERKNFITIRFNEEI